jgi:hypothetical protein
MVHPPADSTLVFHDDKVGDGLIVQSLLRRLDLDRPNPTWDGPTAAMIPDIPPPLESISL